MEFTKGKAVCKSYRAAIIKAKTTQAKLVGNDELHAEIYREATENGNGCLITPTEQEEL